MEALVNPTPARNYKMSRCSRVILDTDGARVSLQFDDGYVTGFVDYASTAALRVKVFSKLDPRPQQ